MVSSKSKCIEHQPFRQTSRWDDKILLQVSFRHLAHLGWCQVPTD